MRTTARETLFKIIFSNQFSEETDEKFNNALYKNDKLNESDVAYCEKIISVIKEREAKLNEIIDRYSLSFPQTRIFYADKSILYIAIAEILFCDDIPDKVSVNEAANIASKYSSEKSASFISGILSSVIKEKNEWLK